MHVNVALEVAGLGESLAAREALVGLFACVGAKVLLESGRVDESLRAHVTLVGLLLCVGLDVDHGVGSVAEALDCGCVSKRLR